LSFKGEKYVNSLEYYLPNGAMYPLFVDGEDPICPVHGEGTCVGMMFIP